MANWAVNFNIPQNALNGLLPILKQLPELKQLPKDSRTILKTKIISEIKPLCTINPGLYFHFGLTSALKLHFKNNEVNNISVVKVVIGIDGLPVSKSSSSKFWPILCYIRPFKHSVFPIGIYWGHEKPFDSNEYL